MTSAPTQRTLQQLVLDLKGDRSYERLARDCGGVPTAKRLQQIATTPHPKTFPDPPTVEGLAQGLGVTVTEVVLAAATSLGLNVHRGGDPSEVVLAGVGDLPTPARDAVLSVAREMVRLHTGSGKTHSVVTRINEASRAKPEPDRQDPADVDLEDLAARREGRPKRRDEVDHIDE